jgi:hypothetical protein
MGYVDGISVAGGIVQTLIYLDYSQPFWPPLSGSIAVALSNASTQGEIIPIYDAQEKGFARPEKVSPDETSKQTEIVVLNEKS